MRSKRYRAPKGEARLEAFLARATTLSLGEVRGFLFALNAAPELVKPSEWIPFIFSGEEPEFRDMEEAEEVMGALMHL
jgi:yecA family protein